MSGKSRPPVKSASTTRPPAFARPVNWLVTRLIGAGLPAGPNVLLTVRGRRTGRPRTTPVAVLELGNRRWIQGAYGEVDWVRNLRHAGEATLSSRSGKEPVRSIELTGQDAERFFAEVLAGYLCQSPPVLRSILPVLFGLKDAVDDPATGARNHPVFEILPAAGPMPDTRET